MQLGTLQAVVDSDRVIVIVARYPRDAHHTTVSYAVEHAGRALEILGTLRRCGLKPNVYSVPYADAQPPAANSLLPVQATP
jgi:hypothetical protein